MNTQFLVDLALKQQACTTEELAAKLDVSADQLKAWAQNGLIPDGWKTALKALANLGDPDVHAALRH